MTRRVKNSLAERRLLLDFESYPTVDFSRPSPTGRRDTITTNSLDLKPKNLTLEMLLETKKMVEEMEIGNYQIIPADFSQIEQRVTARLASDDFFFFERPRVGPFWSTNRRHPYEEHREAVKAQQEAQAAERTRKSYEELFV